MSPLDERLVRATQAGLPLVDVITGKSGSIAELALEA